MRGGVAGGRSCPGQWSLPLGLSCRGGLPCGALKVGGSVGCRAPPSCASPALPDCLCLSLSWVHPAGARGTPATEGCCGVLPSQPSPRRSPLGEAPVHPAGRGTCLPCRERHLSALPPPSRGPAPPTELHGGPLLALPGGVPASHLSPGVGRPPDSSCSGRQLGGWGPQGAAA